MERDVDSDGDDRPKPNSLADKIKKIDVPIKGILKKPIISSDSHISSSKSVKETHSWEENKGQTLNHEDLYNTGKCELNLERDLNYFDADIMSKVGKSSFAEKLKGDQTSSKINFRFLESLECQGDVDVTIPIESVKKVQEKCSNVLFGYFLGKRLAFPVVEYFVKNRWSIYGLQKSMMNARGFFFFKFDSKEGLEQVMQDGPWLIRNVPIFLKPWSSKMEIKKEELKKIPVWVKMHDVPLVAYTEDGLSLIASRIGVPQSLDNETTNMCLESWGKSSYARAIIELDAEKDLKESVSVAIPNVEEGGFLNTSIKVEYEWTPPRCPTCCVFGHTLANCPKHSHVELKDNKGKGKHQMDDDGFTMVEKKKKANKKGVVIKEKPRFEYRPVPKQKDSVNFDRPKPTNIQSSIKIGNPFSCLGSSSGTKENDDSDYDEVIEVNEETSLFMKDGNTNKGASTPATSVLNV